MRTGEPALDNDGVVCVMHGLGMEVEIGNTLLVLMEEGADPGVAVPDLACRDDLVARVTEGLDAALEVVTVLGFQVLADRRLTPLSQPTRPVSCSGAFE